MPPSTLTVRIISPPEPEGATAGELAGGGLEPAAHGAAGDGGIEHRHRLGVEGGEPVHRLGGAGDPGGDPVDVEELALVVPRLRLICRHLAHVPVM
jgi:hypothetical protein